MYLYIYVYIINIYIYIPYSYKVLSHYRFHSFNKFFPLPSIATFSAFSKVVTVFLIFIEKIKIQLTHLFFQSQPHTVTSERCSGCASYYCIILNMIPFYAAQTIEAVRNLIPFSGDAT